MGSRDRAFTSFWMTLLAITASALALDGCAAAAFRWRVLSEMKEMQTALNKAKEERKELCQWRPEECKLRLKLDDKKPLDDPTAWSYELRPTYRVDFDIGWGKLRGTMKRRWLGIEYYAEIMGPVSDQVDAGLVTERDGWLIARKAAEQAKEMLRQQVQGEYRAAQARDQQLWQTTATVLLAAAVVSLNAYTLSSTQIRQPSNVPAQIPNAAPAAVPRAAPTAAQCTYGLWALGGRSLCAMSDGSVTAR